MFERYYKLPLKFNNLRYRLLTNDGNKAIDFLISDERFKDDILESINGNSKFLESNDFRYYCCEITYKGKKILRLRGWGYLTGIGTMNLPTQEAIDIQDEFGKYIENKLNNKCNG